MRSRLTLLLLVNCLPTFCVSRASAQSVPSQQDTLVKSASLVMNEIMAIPAKRIPQSIIADARGIAIIPDVVKGGFVVGVRRGRGVVLVRDAAGNWQPPHFVTLTGGSVGFQAGLQATDLILVFKTARSIEGLLAGKFTLGVDAAAAAGPVGRQAAAATDGRLRAEIYSYSRSRGLFAGVSLDGSVLEVDHPASASYYSGVAPPLGTPRKPQPLPDSAVRLVEQVAAYASPAHLENAAPVPSPASVASNPAPTPSATLTQTTAPLTQANLLRSRLAQSSRTLQPLLDGRWQQYLALPAEVYGTDVHPPVATLNKSLANFRAVAGNPQYRTLAQRAEFHSTFVLLQSYVATLSQATSRTLPLPPPPNQ